MGYSYEIFYITCGDNYYDIKYVYTDGENSASYQNDNYKYLRKVQQHKWFLKNDDIIIKNISEFIKFDINTKHNYFEVIRFEKIKSDYEKYANEIFELDELKSKINNMTSVEEIKKYIDDINIDKPQWFVNLKEIYNNCLKNKTNYVVFAYTP